MENNIYYNPENNGVFVTSNYAEIQKRMDLGIDPKVAYRKISVSDFDSFTIKSIGFDGVDNLYFQGIKDIFANHEFEAVAFHASVADLSDVVLNVKHLVVGDNSKINIAEESFRNLEEITFLSVKTFKGKILDKIGSVTKLILWYENSKTNAILSMFPNLKELYIYNGSLIQLDLTANALLERLQLHRCLKLEKVNVPFDNHLQKVIVESCNKLDRSNLPSS